MMIRLKVHVLLIVRRNSGLVLAIILLLIGAQSPALASEQWDSADLARLKGGEVIVETLHEDQPGGAARSSALFYGDAQALWDVIGDCRYALIYVKGLRECEVLQSGNSHMVIRHRARNSWYTPTLDFSFTADRTADGIGTAKLLDGNLKVLEGSWEVRPIEAVATSIKGGEALIEGEGASIVTHEIRVQPNFLAPRWLIRRSLLRDLPDMLACVRGLANASADQQAGLADRQRCPGDLSTLSK